MKTRMQNSKQEFLKKWIKGLKIYNNFKKEMTILERRKAIKLSSDVAIASTRNVSTYWSRALITDVSRSVDGASKIIVEQILDRELGNKNKASMITTCSKKIMRKSRRLVAHQRKARRVEGTSVKARSIAKRLVKKRTRVLKSLVPGGKQMDEICLIKETLDYITSLQVQVDVMRNIAAFAERLDHRERLM